MCKINLTGHAPETNERVVARCYITRVGVNLYVNMGIKLLRGKEALENIHGIQEVEGEEGKKVIAVVVLPSLLFFW